MSTRAEILICASLSVLVDQNRHSPWLESFQSKGKVDFPYSLGGRGGGKSDTRFTEEKYKILWECIAWALSQALGIGEDSLRKWHWNWDFKDVRWKAVGGPGTAISLIFLKSVSNQVHFQSHDSHCLQKEVHPSELCASYSPRSGSNLAFPLHHLLFP